MKQNEKTKNITDQHLSVTPINLLELLISLQKKTPLDCCVGTAILNKF